MTKLSHAFIQSIRIKRDDADDSEFPFCLPALEGLQELEVHPQVTFFVGENGSGKSTLLEAIAIAAGLSAQGGTRNMRIDDSAGRSTLSEHMTLVRGVRRPRDSFFLRAESFFNVATLIDEVGASGSYGGKSLHHQSHGESFLSLIEHRFGKDGLFLLDEPEAALSPQRQLTFLAYFHALVQQGGQFIVATHSPILLAYPNATIYRFDEEGIASTEYDDLEHVHVTRDFLNNPARYLRHLLSEDEE
ncbi:MAG: AAA family ATPase [Polyangiales bacterium]